MIKFDVKNRLSGFVQFTAEIDCTEDVSISIKMGLAVKWAIKNNADLSYAKLSGADLSYADLSYANLRDADLSDANLSDANLRGANLIGANLSGVNLSYANLSYAKLSGADLSDADLSDANLRGANLSYANLRDAKNMTPMMSFGPVGKEKRTGYAILHENQVMVRLGCFWDTEKKAIAAVSEKYGARSSYVAVIKAACAEVKTQMKEKK